MVFHLSEVGPIADIKQNVKQVIHSTDRLELLDPHLGYTDLGSSVAEYISCFLKGVARMHRHSCTASII